MISLVNGLSFLFIFSKNKLLCITDLFYFFLQSLSFISALIYIISFLVLTLGFVCSSFCNFFNCKVRLLFEIFLFLVVLYHYSLSSFVASQWFGTVVFLFSSVSKYFLICSLTFLLIHYFFSTILFSLHIFVFLPFFFLIINYQVYIILIWKYAWFDFTLLKFTETCFVHNMLFVPRSVPCAREKNVYFAVWGWNVLFIYVKSLWSNMSFKAIVSLSRKFSMWMT